MRWLGDLTGPSSTIPKVVAGLGAAYTRVDRAPSEARWMIARIALCCKLSGWIFISRPRFLRKSRQDGVFGRMEHEEFLWLSLDVLEAILGIPYTERIACRLWNNCNTGQGLR